MSYTDDQGACRSGPAAVSGSKALEEATGKGTYKRAYGESNNERTTEKGVHTKSEVHTTHTRKKYPDISDTLKGVADRRTIYYN